MSGGWERRTEGKAGEESQADSVLRLEPRVGLDPPTLRL